MKFGVCLIPERSIDATLSLLKTIEEEDFDFVWAPDDESYGDAFAILAVCALKSKNLGLGVGVTNPYERHPVKIARAIATVNDISEEGPYLG